jgi:transposase
VFTLHGVDAEERAVLRRDLRRGQLAAFFAKPAPTEVVLEACGGSHHWARTLSQLGLIPPQYVKPGACPSEGQAKAGVKRGKTDRNRACPRAGRRPDPWAEAISEAASRPQGVHTCAGWRSSRPPNKPMLPR